MKFRLKKGDYGIELEQFLKAVRLEEDYQKIRFMVKDGLIQVNGETEYARRRILQPGDEVIFKNKHYYIYPHQDDREQQEAFEKSNRSTKDKSAGEDERNDNQEDEGDHFIVHNKKPLTWTQKYEKKK